MEVPGWMLCSSCSIGTLLLSHDAAPVAVAVAGTAVALGFSDSIGRRGGDDD